MIWANFRSRCYFIVMVDKVAKGTMDLGEMHVVVAETAEGVEAGTWLMICNVLYCVLATAWSPRL